MLAFSSPQLPNFGWPLEESLSHDQNYLFISQDPQNSHPPFPQHITPPLFQQNVDLIGNHSESPKDYNHSDPDMVKKLHHNASERDRRKKINNLYLALRSLLPDTDRTKKLSIPATVSRVVRYIPDLQQQVKRLAQKKEELLSNISRQDDLIHEENLRKSTMHESSVTVSANWIPDREVVVQISTYRNHKTELSSILLDMEDGGFVLLNSSSFESYGGRIFYNLHFQVEAASSNVEFGDLTRKIASLYDKKEMFLL